MKNVLRFDVTKAPQCIAGLFSGLTAYATDLPKVGPPTTLWLQLCSGEILMIRAEMHDLSGWDEIGTLVFELVSAETCPKMHALHESWLEVKTVEKLVYQSDDCLAECGFSVITKSGDTLTVVPGAEVYTLAIAAPFHSQLFMPENSLETYLRVDLTGNE